MRKNPSEQFTTMITLLIDGCNFREKKNVECDIKPNQTKRKKKILPIETHDKQSYNQLSRSE